MLAEQPEGAAMSWDGQGLTFSHNRFSCISLAWEPNQADLSKA